MQINKTASILAMMVALLGGCSSGLDQAVQQDIDAQIRSQQPTLARCYAAALQRDARVQGQMVVSFRVTESGDFSEVAVLQSQVADPGLQQCVVRRTDQLALTRKLDRPVLVTYPLAFKVALR